MADAKSGSFWSPAAAAAVLFAWFAVFLDYGIQNDTQRVGAVLAGTSAAIFGGVALDRFPQTRRRRS